MLSRENFCIGKIELQEEVYKTTLMKVLEHLLDIHYPKNRTTHGLDLPKVCSMSKHVKIVSEITKKTMGQKRYAHFVTTSHQSLMKYFQKCCQR